MAEEVHISPSRAEPSQEEILDSPIGSRTLTTPPSSRQEFVNLTTIKKLTGDNYPIWKFQMSIMLRARKLLEIVDESAPRVRSKNGDEWLDKDVACQSYLISAIDSQLIRKLMSYRISNRMWRRLCIVHKPNATENVQLLQQQFFDMCMKLEAKMMDHINNVEQLANQLNDLGEPVSERRVIGKILNTLPPSFRHLQTAWINVPHHDQSIETLILCLLMEESRNCIQGFHNGEEEKLFFPSCCQGTNTKNFFLEAKKEHLAKIAKLKETTRCKKLFSYIDFSLFTVLQCSIEFRNPPLNDKLSFLNFPFLHYVVSLF